MVPHISRTPADWLPAAAGSWEALLLDAYRAGVRDLRERLGPDRAAWRFGRLNAFTFAPPLRAGAQPPTADAAPPIAAGQMEIRARVSVTAALK